MLPSRQDDFSIRWRSRMNRKQCCTLWVDFQSEQRQCVQSGFLCPYKRDVKYLLFRLHNGHTLYGANELTAARNGFKHRPSVTVYSIDPKNVIRVGEGERRFINGRYQEGAFFVVYHGKLRNISMESTPGDPACDTRGSILAQSKGVQTMSQENLFPEQQGTPPATPVAPEISAQAAPATPPAPAALPAPATPNIEAGANPVTPAPAVHTASPSDLNRDMISKMYDRGDISPEIMAQAFDQGWTPKQALDAESKISGFKNGVDGKPNIAGFPNMPNHDRNEPNGDMIMAAAFLMEHCGFKPGDFDGKTNKDSVLRLDERTIDAATSGDLRGIRFSDLCAHAANAYYEPRTTTRRKLASKRPEEYFVACVKAQPYIDEKLDFDHVEDLRASADTGLSTIGLQNIWAVINSATIGKGYQEIPTVWQRICKQASVPNFLTHTVHRTQLVGKFQRLNRIGAEPPHATYMEDMTEGKIDEWGLMLTLSRKDIINDAVGIFTSAAADLGREAARTLERECFAALLSDGAQLFRTQHRNLLTGANSVFGFDALDKAFTLFRQQKGMNGEPIMVRPSFLSK